jgi:hypothetical protein
MEEEDFFTDHCCGFARVTERKSLLFTNATAMQLVTAKLATICSP